MPNYEIKYSFIDSVIINGNNEADAEYQFERDFDKESYPGIKMIDISEIEE